MNRVTELFKIIILSILEGVSEWLPISSSGHMLLLDEFIKLEFSSDFKEVFFVLIQLAAIFAVVLLYFKKIFPFQFKNKAQSLIKKDIIVMWLKVTVSCIPGAIITLLFDDFIEEHFHTPVVISFMLIIYGIAFIGVERWNKKRISKFNNINDISYKLAFYIGIFQVLSIIPGTSRSGATIIGALILGVNRSVASEFSFFLAIPVMLGLSFIKLSKFGFIFTKIEVVALVIGMLVAFLVSIFVIKFLIKYIKKHDFKVFGIYRIILGVLLLISFGMII